MQVNFNRLLHLIMLEVRQKWKSFLLILGIGFLIPTFYHVNPEFSLFTMITSFTETTVNFNPFYSFDTASQSKFHFTWFNQLLLVASSTLASFAFTEYAKKESAHFHLSLPASITEKWLAKVILYLLILPATIIILYHIFIQLTEYWGGSQIAHQVIPGFFDPYLWGHIVRIILSLCFIFLGATYFKKFSLFKTVLAGLLLYLGYNFLQLTSLVIINENIDLFAKGKLIGFSSIHEMIGSSGYRFSGIKNPFGPFLGLSPRFFTGLCAMVALILSFLKYRELES